MSNKWLEITCDVPEELADMLADFLTGLSGKGVCMENLDVDAFSQSEITHATTVSIKTYFDARDDINLRMNQISHYLKHLSEEHPGMTLSDPVLSEVRSEDWSSSWKINFKPLRIGRRLLIVPTWEQAETRPDDILLRIDPGMAFGTGGHETTRLCLELLEDLFDAPGAAVTPSVLDLGTGSGILAMAAWRLGAGHVMAVDIDPEAVQVARENFELNQLSDKIECDTTPLESIPETFDIILANILAEELARLAPCLTERLKPGGMLILSGILSEKEQLVLEGFASTGLRHVRTRHLGDWVAMHYQREGDR
ncbi:MAG TPA: 50S ribosomal protein L11 methyltransferase [Deltaproteobacteria bacterium]|nr:50S ribosomal protein L11 methyltransferase [Deltaproteobacteria bacterium]HQB39580.1 50S ribosomal protein L11 methyltransferase [Deltaproteobacteria bacterium]